MHVANLAAYACQKLVFIVLIDILLWILTVFSPCKTGAKPPGHLGCSRRRVQVFIILPSRVLAPHAPAPNKVIRTVRGMWAHVSAVRHCERALVLQVTLLASEAVRYDNDSRDSQISVCGSPLSPPRGFSPARGSISIT